jgi:hypothetical protein
MRAGAWTASAGGAPIGRVIGRNAFEPAQLCPPTAPARGARNGCRTARVALARTIVRCIGRRPFGGCVASSPVGGRRAFPHIGVSDDIGGFVASGVAHFGNGCLGSNVRCVEALSARSFIGQQDVAVRVLGGSTVHWTDGVRVVSSAARSSDERQTPCVLRRSVMRAPQSESIHSIRCWPPGAHSSTQRVFDQSADREMGWQVRCTGAIMSTYRRLRG